jgi:hypothetical protein
MGRRYLVLRGALAIVVSSMIAPIAVIGAGPAGKTPAGKTWTAPRTGDGQPDLQGVWANNVATPMQRPKALEGRPTLTEQEVAALKEAAAELFAGDGDAAFGDQVFEAALAKAKTFTSSDGKTGDYNHFWLVERDFDNRSSLITDPADGRIPPLTAEAQKAAAERRDRSRGEGDLSAGRADSWEDRGLSERCITFGAPRMGAGYNSYVQVFQSRDTVVLLQETIHDARIVPLDGRPHPPASVRLWNGDSRGHWEGDTLVIDTTNYLGKSNLMGASEKLHVVERLRRVGPTTLQHEVTFEDPATWTKPWTLMVPLKQVDEKMFEYACHEGNSGLAGILAGARAEEKRAAEAAAKTSSK